MAREDLRQLAGMVAIELEDDTQVWRNADEALEFALRNMVTPPIKGEITRGKVRWRGLRLVIQPPKIHEENGRYSCEQRIELWQRDKRIF